MEEATDNFTSPINKLDNLNNSNQQFYINSAISRISKIFNISFDESVFFFDLCKDTRSKIKKRLIDFIINIFRASGLSDNSSGFLIRCCHFFSPLIMIYAVIFWNKYLAYLSALAMLGAVGFFIFFGSCFLSKVEYILTKNDLTITDPFIEICGDEINEKTRMTYTIFIMSIIFSIYITAFCVRFFILKY